MGQVRRQRQGNQLNVKSGKLSVPVIEDDLLGQYGAIDLTI